MKVNELTQVAILGTGRSPLPPLSSTDAALAPAIPIVQSAGAAEDQLLSSVAVLSAYETCGASAPVSKTAHVSPAPHDQKPACSRLASELLSQVLSLTNTQTKQMLMSEWCTAAAGAGRRVAHALLPELLDYAAVTRAVRAAIQPVIGERGAWLMEQNPAWQFTSTGQEDVQQLWTTGNAEQRISALTTIRQSDPAKARELVQSTWKEDGADERAAFVAAMRVGLSSDDEPFLESALDDRSKQVRAAAIDLLSRLEGSALQKRMIARAESLVIFKPGATGGVLKRAKPREIAVELPADRFDATWERDGIVEKPVGKIGRRQWWLRQFLGLISPAYWSSKFQLTPEACIQAAAGDHADLLVASWTDAARRHEDPHWLSALLLHSLRGDKKSEPAFDLVPLLPPEHQPKVVDELLSAQLDAASLMLIIGALRGQSEAKLAQKLIGAVERELGTTGVDYNYALAGILEALAHRLPPGMHDPLMTRWVGPAWEANRKALDNFFFILGLRRKITTEFAQ